MNERALNSVVKMDGAGNSFLIANQGQRECAWVADYFESQKRDRADGLVLYSLESLTPGKSARVVWRFLNSDRSVARMCGNAARCLTSLLCNRVLGVSAIDVYDERSNEKPVFSGRVSRGESRVSMPMVEIRQEMTVPDSIFRSCSFLDSGVPHVVLELASDQELSKKEILLFWARSWGRWHPFFEADGANVTFWAPLSKNKISAVTFERGVENFTLACGTGAVAAATACLRNSNSAAIETWGIQMPGGGLEVTLVKESDKSYFAELSGDVRFHYARFNCDMDLT